MPRFTPTVDGLSAELPFTAPERLERDRGRPLVLRLGANESAFGVADGVREAMAAALDRVAWYGRAAAVLAALLDRGVFVRKPPVPPLDRCVRVSVGAEEQRRRFGEILRDLRSAGVF